RRVGACIGFGQRERSDDFTARNARQIFALLLLGSLHGKAMRANSDIGAENRTEGRRGAAEDHSNLSLLAQIQAKPAIGHRRGQAEEAELPHLADDLFRNVVFFLDAILVWDQPFINKPLDDVAQLLKGFLVDCVRHYCVLTSICPPELPLEDASGLCEGAPRGPDRKQFQVRRAVSPEPAQRWRIAQRVWPTSSLKFPAVGRPHGWRAARHLRQPLA